MKAHMDLTKRWRHTLFRNFGICLPSTRCSVSEEANFHPQHSKDLRSCK